MGFYRVPMGFYRVPMGSAQVNRGVEASREFAANYFHVVAGDAEAKSSVFEAKQQTGCCRRRRRHGGGGGARLLIAFAVL